MYFPVVKMSPALNFETKAKQRSNGAFVSPTLMYSNKSLYMMRKCMLTVSWANYGLWGRLPLNITQNSLPTFLQKVSPRSVLKNARPDPSFAKKNLIYLSSLRQLNRNTAFAVIVSLMNKSVHRFNSILIGRDQVPESRSLMTSTEFEDFFVEKHEIYLCNILIHWWVGCLRNSNLPITCQIQLLRWEDCISVYCPEEVLQRH